jgi:hypothetical protein
MVEYQQVEYIIDKDGNVIERVLNVKGKGCLELQPVKGSRGTIAALSKPTSEGGWIDQ